MLLYQVIGLKIDDQGMLELPTVLVDHAIIQYLTFNYELYRVTRVIIGNIEAQTKSRLRIPLTGSLTTRFSPDFTAYSQP